MKELDKALEQYEQIFDDSFPMAAMSGYEPSEVVSVIEKCVKEKKDVYDMGILSLDIIY